jgi:hypothetical protein
MLELHRSGRMFGSVGLFGDVGKAFWFEGCTCW